MKIAVILTCHNRKNKTLDCLRAVYAQVLDPGTFIDVFLCDDGSSDGTSAAVLEQFPDVFLIEGDGNNYWNGGMRLAFGAAVLQAYDHYLWLNDDTTLNPGSIRTLVDTVHTLKKPSEKDFIIVGSTNDPDTDLVTYGGVIRRHFLKRLRFSLVNPKEFPQKCETMNGNCVLIPRAIADRVGNLDASFTHGMGDLDYGLRAGRLGFGIYVAPGFIGRCSRNPVTSTWLDHSLSFKKRLRLLLGPKGLPYKEWLVFCRRHAGLLWPLYVVQPYLRLVIARQR